MKTGSRMNYILNENCLKNGLYFEGKLDQHWAIPWMKTGSGMDYTRNETGSRMEYTLNENCLKNGLYSEGKLDQDWTIPWMKTGSGMEYTLNENWI